MNATNATYSDLPFSTTTYYSYTSIVRQFIWLSLYLLLTYLLIYTLSEENFSRNELYDFVNFTGPLYVLIICALTAYQLIRRNPTLIWTPFPWFLLASAAYFGFGPLLHIFGNAETIAYVNGFWQVDNYDIYRTNLLNIIGILIVTFFYWSIGFIKLTSFQRLLSTSGKMNIVLLTLVILTIGMFVKYFLALPYEFGMVNYILPGFIFQVAKLVDLGIFLVSFLAFRKGNIWKYILIILLVIELPVDLMKLEKSSFLLTLLMAVLGCYLAQRRITILIYGSLLTIIAYSLISPIVSSGRIVAQSRPSETLYETLSRRYEILTSEDLLEKRKEENEIQGSWSRLCYTNVQAATMYLYDSGFPGHNYSMILWTLVPRILYPDKPNMSAPGTELTSAIVGSDTSSTGATVFGDAYYNGGWIMVVIACAGVGVILAVVTRFGLLIMQNSAFVFLPCIFTGIYMGIRIDGRFVEDYVGAFVIYLATMTIIIVFFGKCLKI
jgi:hypothetical protein